MTLPRLHVVTDDAALGDPRFPGRARALIEAHGPSVALHLRGHGSTGGALYRLAAELAGPAGEAGALLVVNDRLDVALALGLPVQLGRRSLPVRAARVLLGPSVPLGYSAHGADEARAAAEAGADFVVVGTIWPSASHPGASVGGTSRITETAAVARIPVVAIGGVTPERARAALAAGAHGVAVLSGVWGMEDAAAAAAGYLEAMGAVA